MPFPAVPSDHAAAAAKLFAYAPPASSGSAPAGNGPRPSAGSVAPGAHGTVRPEAIPDACARIWAELGSVRQRVSEACCLVTSASGSAPTSNSSSSSLPLARNDAFLDAVDFLEQVRERLEGLIDAGASGAFASDERLFEEVLTVHDGVARAVEVMGPVASGAAAAPPPDKVASLALLLNFTRQPDQAPALAASAPSSSGAGAVANDLAGLFTQSASIGAPTPSAAASAAPNPFEDEPHPAAAKPAKAEFAPTGATGGDDFDPFGQGSKPAQAAGGGAPKPAAGADSTLADLEALLK